MKMFREREIVACAALCMFIGTILIAVGCSKTSSSPTVQQRSEPKSSAGQTATELEAATTAARPTAVSQGQDADPASEGMHAHKPGSHGGLIVPIGSDNYHAEAVIEKAGDFRLLILAKDESRIQEVEIQTLKAYVKGPGQPDSTPIVFSAVPQDGDAEGKTSQFVGQLPDELRGRPVEVTIPSFRIGGERFRVGFSTASASHQEEMPSELPAAEEQALYLTPSGKYTEADIAANGRVTASQKFKGVLSSHDMKPKPGDRICPVTLTKANPQFTWIIDGKPYEFCCPPCVDEFVKTAKEQPENVNPPDSYIK